MNSKLSVLQACLAVSATLNGDREGADVRLGEMGRPAALDDHPAAGPHMDRKAASSYRLE